MAESWAEWGQGLGADTAWWPPGLEEDREEGPPGQGPELSLGRLLCSDVEMHPENAPERLTWGLCVTTDVPDLSEDTGNWGSL